jgi:hypothetical protein
LEVSMNVPPAATNRSRIAIEVSGSVVLPNLMAPRHKALTVRRLPRVRYSMRMLLVELTGSN